MGRFARTRWIFVMATFSPWRHEARHVVQCSPSQQPTKDYHEDSNRQIPVSLETWHAGSSALSIPVFYQLPGPLSEALRSLCAVRCAQRCGREDSRSTSGILEMEVLLISCGGSLSVGRVYIYIHISPIILCSYELHLITN